MYILIYILESKSGIAGLACESIFLNDSSCRIGTKSLKPKDENRNFHLELSHLYFQYRNRGFGHLELACFPQALSLRSGTTWWHFCHCATNPCGLCWSFAPRRCKGRMRGSPFTAGPNLCLVLAGGWPLPHSSPAQELLMYVPTMMVPSPSWTFTVMDHETVHPLKNVLWLLMLQALLQLEGAEHVPVKLVSPDACPQVREQTRHPHWWRPGSFQRISRFPYVPSWGFWAQERLGAALAAQEEDEVPAIAHPRGTCTETSEK